MGVGTIESRIGSATRQLREHVATPVYREGYALILSAGLAAALGLVYWVVAARAYSPDDVGLNSAVISTMLLLASIAQLNLGGGLIRFVPGAGRSTMRLVGWSYAISTVGAALLASGFLGVVRLLQPEASVVDSGIAFAVSFVAATTAWCVFNLQDAVLTGLRRAIWVPVDNALFAVAKLGLLVLFATILPKFGIFASWTLAAVVAVVGINVIIVRKLIPAHIANSAGSNAAPKPRTMARFVAADYVGGLAWIVSITLIPIAITERLGGAENAYYSLAWVMAFPLYMLSSNTATSLVVSVVSDDAHRHDYAHRVFRQTARLVVPGAVILALGAPYFLRLFGEEYAEEGTLTLRLLALSAVPAMVTILYTAVWRAERRLSLLASVRVVQFGAVVLVSLPLIEPLGIVGPAITWLVVQTLAALILLAVSPRVLVGGHSRPPHHARRIFALRNAAERAGLLDLSHRALGRADARRRRAHADLVVPAVLERVPADAVGSSPASWVALELLVGVTDKSVVLVGEAGAGPKAVVKLATSPSASRTLAREAAALRELAADTRLDELRSLLPVALASGEIGNEYYLVESVLHGVGTSRSPEHDAGPYGFLELLAQPIDALHRLTGVERTVDESQLAIWLDLPIEVLERHIAAHGPASWQATALANLEAELRRSLLGRAVTVGRTHGDYAPGNILLAHHGRAVAGILDWELSSSDGISALDHTHLALTSNALLRRREIGEVVTRALDERLEAPDRAFLDGACSALCPGVPVRALVLLDWLRHATDVLVTSEQYADKRIWTALNVDPVLAELA